MANLRFRVLPRFPARLLSDGGIGILKQGADWTVFPNWGVLNALSAVNDPANTDIHVRVETAGVDTFFKLSIGTLLTLASQSGSPYAIQYEVDLSSIADADPGNGKIRFNNATQNLATTLYADLTDTAGQDWTAVLDSLDDSTNTVKGNWSLHKVGDATKRLLGTLTAVTTATGYRKLTIVVVGSSAASPFVTGDLVMFQFTRAGDASSNPNPVVLPEGAAPSTPAANNVAVYAKADGRTYEKDDTGRERRLSGEGGVPQGRLTLQTGVPVMTTTQSAKTTIFYTPFNGRFVPLYDGTAYSMVDTGAELSQTTTDTTKSPAAVANNSNYDLFVWDDAGTMRCTRGPAWTSDTARGTGAGTTELVRVGGFFLNANSITNGPAAQRGTYVGTVRSNGTASIDWIFGALAVGGTAAVFGVYNAFHRADVATTVGDTTDSWAYSTATWRAAGAQNTMRVSFINGLGEDCVEVRYHGASSNTGGSCYIGIGVDSTSAPTGLTGVQPFTIALSFTAAFSGVTGLGFHFLQAIEYTAAGTGTFYGDNGTVLQTGLVVTLRM